MNTFVKTIKANKISNEFLRSLNGLMGLSPRELELFVEILKIHIRNSSNKNRTGFIDSSDNRKFLMSETNITPDNMSRYMKMFRQKGLLFTENGRTIINKALIPIVIGGNKIQITLILKINDNE